MDYFGRQNHLELSFSLSEAQVVNQVQFFELNLLGVVPQMSLKRYDLALYQLNLLEWEFTGTGCDQKVS